MSMKHILVLDGCLISGYKTKYVPNPHYVDAKWVRLNMKN